MGLGRASAVSEARSEDEKGIAMMILSYVWMFADIEVIAMYLAVVTLFLIVKGATSWK